MRHLNIICQFDRRNVISFYIKEESLSQPRFRLSFIANHF
nr:MAG TPA: hypothetical protein [Caudoviricetes sp.]